MADKKNTVAYAPLDAVLVRTPLLPVESYRPAAPANSRSEWIDAAITVGSLSLAQARPAERAAAPRLRYGIRMATRPTPYGLFSGVSLARWDEATTLSLADAPPRTRTRPDMAWLLRLVMELEGRRDIRRALTLRANTAALIRGGRIILPERLTHAGDGAEPPRVSVRATAAARLVMRLARAPVGFLALFDAVTEAAPDVAPDRIEGLLHELIDQSLLLTNLRPPLTCESPAHWILECLADIPAAAEVHGRLAELVREASAWDSYPAKERASAYRRLGVVAIELGAKPNESPMQVDTVFALAGDRLGREIGEEVARAASIMLRLSPFPRGFPYLRSYHQAFVARYGEHRDVPLLELLDPHLGLGPPDPNAHAGWMDFEKRDETLLALACDAVRDRCLSIELDEAVLAHLDTRQDESERLPASLDICAFVCARPGGVERGEFKVVVGPNVGSPCAGRNIARFANILGEGGQEAVRMAARVEADSKDALIAEIVYLPRTFRLGNVAIHPVTHANEIALGVSAAVSSRCEVPLDELTVGVDERRFYLRWPPHAENVVVSSSHMLNFLEAPPLCRFLAHMHADEETQLHVFDWGPASRFPFLPRVQAGKVVLRPAEWRLDVTTRRSAAKSREAFSASLERYRTTWQLPGQIYLSSGDVRLLLDLDDPEHIEELRRETRRLKPGMHVLLQEALPGLDHAWLPGPGGHYVVELVVSLARKDTVEHESQRVPVVTREQMNAPRMAPPGSDWLYLKLYGSPETEEDLLTGPVAAFLDKAAASGLSAAFFFVRYSDPDPHLRVRLRVHDQASADTMLIELCSLGRSLIEHELCSRFAVDTYEREIERYGGPAAISFAEELFAADSEVVLELFRFLKCTEVSRELLSAITAADLVDGLNLGDALTDLASQLRSVRQEAGPEYRKLKASIQKLIENPAVLSREPGGLELLRLLDRRRAMAYKVGKELHRLDAQRRLTCSLGEICHSFLHMHCNRLLGRDRAQERKVLGLMLRLCEARKARHARAHEGETRPTWSKGDPHSVP
jgi:thiopeptide-type bacteriocin biosynthesis protein